MQYAIRALFSAAAFTGLAQAQSVLAQDSAPAALQIPIPQAPAMAVHVPPATPSAIPASLPAGTPLTVMLNDELSTAKSKTGDVFHVTVLHDVLVGDTIVIPKGAIGQGDIAFAADKGGFGRAGLIVLALRSLQLGKTKFALDGRYREEGRNKNGATAATWVAVGVFSGFIKGKSGVINKGRELGARTGEEISFIPGAPPPPVPVSPWAPAPDVAQSPDVPVAPETTSPEPQVKPETK